GDAVIAVASVQPVSPHLRRAPTHIVVAKDEVASPGVRLIGETVESVVTVSRRAGVRRCEAGAVGGSIVGIRVGKRLAGDEAVLRRRAGKAVHIVITKTVGSSEIADQRE